MEAERGAGAAVTPSQAQPARSVRVAPQRTLAECEAVIKRGIGTFVEVGEALLEIRDRRLYRESGYTTWDDYTRERWGWSKSHANRHIESAKVAGLLAPIGVIPANEAQSRELVPLLNDEKAMVEVWRGLREKWGDRVTAEKVREAVELRSVDGAWPEPPSRDAAWEQWSRWAESLLDSPFRKDDRDNLHWFATKFFHQIRAPVVAALVQMADEHKLPLLRLASDDDLAEFLRWVVPYAKGTNAPLPIEADTQREQSNLGIALKMCAMRACGIVFGEIEYRGKSQDLAKSRAAVLKRFTRCVDKKVAALHAQAAPVRP